MILIICKEIFFCLVLFIVFVSGFELGSYLLYLGLDVKNVV